MKKQTQITKSGKPVTEAVLKKTLDKRFKISEKKFDKKFETFKKETDEGFKAAEKRDIRLEMKTDEGFKAAEKRDIRLEMKMDEGFREMDEKARGYRDKILTGLDKVVKELQDMREENAAGTLHFRRIDVSLEEHEERLKVLEHAKN